MPDQVADKRTIGVAPDILVVREQVMGYRDDAERSAGTAEGYSRSASLSAEHAGELASSAADSARQAADWAVVHNQGLIFGPNEPPVKIDGMLWLKTNELAGTITSFERWDANAAGAGLFPGDSTYPAEDTYPSDQGAWAHFKVAASAVAQ